LDTPRTERLAAEERRRAEAAKLQKLKDDAAAWRLAREIREYISARLEGDRSMLIRRLARVVLALAFLTLSYLTTLSLGPASGNVNTPTQIAATAPQAQITLFATEQAAQKHCPADTVVWLNTASGIYHLKGQRWYGRTKHGAYVCEKEADAAGDRETLNGQ
jgi:hypothetical protein